MLGQRHLTTLQGENAFKGGGTSSNVIYTLPPDIKIAIIDTWDLEVALFKMNVQTKRKYYSFC